MSPSDNIAAGRSTPQSAQSPADLTATAAIAQMRAGQLTSVALVSACLERVKALEPDVMAWAFLDPNHAMTQAREADERAKRGAGVGALNGLPVGIKDVIDTADMPTVCGSPVFAGRQPEEDAWCVAALRAAGAVIMGKTVTTELASRAPGPTRHPRNLDHTPGGSSSGSAAAVACGMVPLALGTQTAGSVIRPAAFCGVCAMKPTLGLISRRGVLLQAHTLDTVGVYGRSIEDLALLTDALAIHDSADPVSIRSAGMRLAAAVGEPDPSEPRLAFVQTPAWQETEQVTRDALAELVAFLGDRVVELELTALDHAIEAQQTVMAAENAAYYGPLLARAGDKISEVMTKRLQAGAEVPAHAYIHALNEREPMYQSLQAVFADYAAILTPAAPGPAPKGLESTGSSIFNGMWTYLGVPAVTLPLLEAQGMPIGVQLIGARRHEARLLATARWLRDKVANAGAG